MNCQQAQEDVAIAVLTRQPVEAATVVHLETCPTCAAEAAQIRPLADLLAMAEPPTVLAGDQPDSGALDRLLGEAARRQHRRTGRWLGAVAASLVLAVPLGIVVAHQLGDDSAPPSAVPTASAPTTVERTATNAATGVTANVKIWSKAWGSGLTVSISGVTAGTKCTLSVVEKDGTRQTAATWWATYQGSASVDGGVAASVSDIARLEVLDDSGRVLVPVQFG